MPLNNVTSIASPSGTIVEILGMTLIILIATVIISVLISVTRGYNYYKKYTKIINFIIKLLDYSIYGLLTIIVIGAPCVIGWAIYQHAINNPGSTGNFLKIVGISVALFTSLTTIGYLTKERIWKRLFKYHNQSVKEKEQTTKPNGDTT